MVNVDGLNMATSTCQNSKGINQQNEALAIAIVAHMTNTHVFAICVCAENTSKPNMQRRYFPRLLGVTGQVEHPPLCLKLSSALNDKLGSGKMM